MEENKNLEATPVVQEPEEEKSAIDFAAIHSRIELEVVSGFTYHLFGLCGHLSALHYARLQSECETSHQRRQPVGNGKQKLKYFEHDHSWYDLYF